MGGWGGGAISRRWTFFYLWKMLSLIFIFPNDMPEGGRERVRGGRQEARMLHRHETSVEEGRVDDGNKRGRNGARHGRRERGSEQGRDCARKGWSKGATK